MSRLAQGHSSSFFGFFGSLVRRIQCTVARRDRDRLHHLGAHSADGVRGRPRGNEASPDRNGVGQGGLVYWAPQVALGSPQELTPVQFFPMGVSLDDAEAENPVAAVAVTVVPDAQ